MSSQIKKQNNLTSPRAIIPILLIPCLFFFVVPAYMISVSMENYQFLNKSLLVKLLALPSLYILCILIGVYYLSKLVKFEKHLTKVLYFLLFWFTISGLLFPIIEKAGMVDPIDTKIKISALTATLAVTSILTLGVYSKYKNYIFIFFGILVGSPLIQNATKIFSFFKDYERGGVTVLSKEKNVLVFSFDGIPGKIALDLINENADLSDQFSDFTSFSNVVGAASATVPSLMSELYGTVNLKAIGNTERELHKLLNKDELLLNDPNYSSFNYCTYQYFSNKPEMVVPIGGISESPSLMKEGIDIYDFLDFVIVRMGTRYLLKTVNFVSSGIFPYKQLSFKILDIQSSTDNDLDLKLENHKGNDWDKKNIQTFNDFNAFIDNLTNDSEVPCIRHMHFTFTHYPVDFDENMNYQSDSYEWHKANQNEKGTRNETLGTLNRISDLLDKLKEIDAYDNSFIVIKSDHGKPKEYYDTSPDNVMINDHDKWGFGRYRPLLMIKEIDKTSDRIKDINRLVTLGDLAVTLRSRFSSIREHAQVPGVDLLNPEKTSGQNEVFYMYIPPNRETDWTLDMHIPITLNRTENLLDQLRNNPAIKLDE